MEPSYKVLNLLGHFFGKFLDCLNIVGLLLSSDTHKKSVAFSQASNNISILHLMSQWLVYTAFDDLNVRDCNLTKFLLVRFWGLKC